MKLQRKHFIVYIYIFKMIMSFNMSKVHLIIIIMEQYVHVATNARAIEELGRC